MNAKVTPRKRGNRSNSSFGSLCERSKMKNNTLKSCECALRARLRPSEITEDSEWSLCTRYRLITASMLRLCALLELANGDLTALSLRPHFVFTVFVYQNAEPRRIFMVEMCGVACRSTMFLLIPPQQMKMPLQCPGAV